MLLSLSDFELATVRSAARPLLVEARAEFLAALAHELDNQRQLGPIRY